MFFLTTQSFIPGGTRSRSPSRDGQTASTHRDHSQWIERERFLAIPQTTLTLTRHLGPSRRFTRARSMSSSTDRTPKDIAFFDFPPQTAGTNHRRPRPIHVHERFERTQERGETQRHTADSSSRVASRPPLFPVPQARRPSGPGDESSGLASGARLGAHSCPRKAQMAASICPCRCWSCSWAECSSR